MVWDAWYPFNATIKGKLLAGLSDLPAASKLQPSRQMIYFTFLTNTPRDEQINNRLINAWHWIITLVSRSEIPCYEHNLMNFSFTF